MWAATSSTVGFLNFSRVRVRAVVFSLSISFSLIGGVGGRFSFSFDVRTSSSSGDFAGTHPAKLAREWGASDIGFSGVWEHESAYIMRFPILCGMCIT